MLIDGSSDVTIPVSFVNPSTGVSQDPDQLPVLQFYGTDGVVPNANGTGAYLDSGSIQAISTGATTTITSAGHGLISGSVVTIAGAAGTTNVNGTHPITVVDANTFTFSDVTSSGSYTSGATWHVPGLFGFLLNSTIRSALEAGKTYLALCYGTFSGTVRTVSFYATIVS